MTVPELFEINKTMRLIFVLCIPIALAGWAIGFVSQFEKKWEKYKMRGVALILPAALSGFAFYESYQMLDRAMLKDLLTAMDSPKAIVKVEGELPYFESLTNRRLREILAHTEFSLPGHRTDGRSEMVTVTNPAAKNYAVKISQYVEAPNEYKITLYTSSPDGYELGMIRLDNE